MTKQRYVLSSVSVFLFVTAFIASMAILILSKPQAVHATPLCGDPQSAFTDATNSITSHYNGVDEGTASSCGNNGQEVANLGANPPVYGYAWQCQEFATRVYNTEGWHSGYFGPAYAALLWGMGTGNPADYTTMAQGNITLSSVKPGDMLVSDEATYGHVFIVQSINTTANTIAAVDQNGADGGASTITYNPSAKNISDGSYFVFEGVVHSVNDHLTNSSPNSSLSAVSMTSGQQMVFWRGSDNSLMAAYYDGTTWHQQGIGSANGFPALSSPPAAVYQPSTNWVQVFWQGSGGRLYQAVLNNGVWVGGWDLNVTTVVNSQPAAAVNGNLVDVFFKEVSGGLGRVFWSGSAWGSQDLGGNFWNMGTAPATFDQSSGEKDVWWKDTAGNLVEAVWNGSQWVGFTMDTGLIPTQPSADLEPASNFQDVFWSNGGNLQEDVYNGAKWNVFVNVPHGTGMATAPTSTAWGSQIDVFWLDSGGNMQEDVWNGALWGNFTVPNIGTIPIN